MAAYINFPLNVKKMGDKTLISPKKKNELDVFFDISLDLLCVANRAGSFGLLLLQRKCYKGCIGFLFLSVDDSIET
mgnify:CR=1 FL=1